MQALRVALLGLVLSGCESVDDVVAKRRAGVEKTFAALSALAPKVKDAPLPSRVAALEVPLVLESGGKGESNAMFVYAADLAKPGAAAPVNLRTLDSVPLLQCGSLLEKKVYFGNPPSRPVPSVTGQYLAACERLRYALVIREVAFVEPKLQLELRHFDKGRLDLEVLAFDLTNGALVGGYAVSATNDEKIDLLDADPNHLRRILQNLESATWDALRAGAKTTFPGSLP
ncbi:MAG: hypothetical protein ACOZQL_40300 [Myxococcota bacterium]